MKTVKKDANYYILTIIMFILSLAMISPLILAFFTSLKPLSEVQAPVVTILPHQWVWSNYIDAMKEGNWARYIYNTFFVTAVTVTVSLIINSMAGYALARVPFKGRNTLFFTTLLGMMIPPQITMIPTFIMLKKMPLMGGNDIFGSGGNGLMNSYLGLIIPYIAGSFGVFLCRQFYLNFPDSLDEAAKIDGCSRLRAYFQIYIPLSTPVLATLAVLKATGSWSEYIWPLIITNKDSMKTIQIALPAFKQETGTIWNLLMAATIITSIPLLLLFIFAQRYFIEGIVTTGIKG